MKHSELPWGQGIEENSVYSETSGQRITECMKMGSFTPKGDYTYLPYKENAAFIVKACNNFYPMLEALKAIDQNIAMSENRQMEAWAKVEKAIKEAE